MTIKTPGTPKRDCSLWGKVIGELTKSQGETVLGSEAANPTTEDRSQHDGEEGPSIDGKVEKAEELRTEVLLVLGELKKLSY